MTNQKQFKLAKAEAEKMVTAIIIALVYKNARVHGLLTVNQLIAGVKAHNAWLFNHVSTDIVQTLADQMTQARLLRKVKNDNFEGYAGGTPPKLDLDF